MAIRTHRAKKGTTTYGVLVNRGRKKEWVGTFRTQREARRAEAEALANPKPDAGRITVADWVDTFLSRYERRAQGQLLRHGAQRAAPLRGRLR
jgi:hypothetical protein